jgi:hypothetical protein
VRGEHGPMTIASSDARAAQVDALQHRHRSGPCLHALDAGDIVMVDDLASEERWKGYAPAALGHGIRSSLSVPLQADGHVIGALNIYSTRPHTFGPRERPAASRLADEAGRALTPAVRVAGQTEVPDRTRQALAAGTVIDQAVGVIMGQNRCSPDEAVAVLRVLSNGDSRLHAVANEMIAQPTRTRPGRRPGSPHSHEDDRTGRRSPHSPTPTRSPGIDHDPQRLAATIESARRMQKHAHAAADQARRLCADNEALRERIRQARTNGPPTNTSAAAEDRATS